MSVMSLIAKVRTKTYVQIKLDETAQLLNEPYVNEVYLTGQNLT